MAKAKTSKKQKRSGKKYLTEHRPFTSELLKNPKLVTEVLLKCIREDDLDSFQDVLISHIITANKTDIARKAGISRRTLYDLMDSKKKFNPELCTIAAVIRAIAA